MKRSACSGRGVESPQFELRKMCMLVPTGATRPAAAAMPILLQWSAGETHAFRVVSWCRLHSLLRAGKGCTTWQCDDARATTLSEPSSNVFSCTPGHNCSLVPVPASQSSSGCVIVHALDCQSDSRKPEHIRVGRVPFRGSDREPTLHAGSGSTSLDGTVGLKVASLMAYCPDALIDLLL